MFICLLISLTLQEYEFVFCSMVVLLYFFVSEYSNVTIYRYFQVMHKANGILSTLSYFLVLGLIGLQYVDGAIHTFRGMSAE